MKKLLLGGFLSVSLVAANAQFTVSSPPSNLTVNAGSAASFTVAAADGTNALTYQWSSPSGPVSGATNATFAFDDVSTNQAGVYSVSVTGPDGSANPSATLTVLQGTLLNVQVSGFASGPSNLLLELFDHDKPATVQNFLHYIRTPAYSNLIIDRLLPGFVLQSGDYDASNQTNSTPNLSPSNYISIGATYVSSTNISPPFPQQLNNEFFADTIISNRAGTIAMALPGNNANGGTSAFFVNLVKNPELDSTVTGGGPYTVFGRFIAGTSVLDYFNTQFSKPALPTNLVFPSNIFTGGIFDYIYLNTNDQVLTDLPENFDAPNIPANNNLFFLNFSFSNTPPPLDTTAPTVTISSPSPNSITTNSYSYTITGTSSDNVAVSLVQGTMQAVTNGAGSSQPAVGYASSVANGSLTNWTMDIGTVDPGQYNLTVFSQDASGNKSPMATNANIIVTAVVTNGFGRVSWVDQSGHSNANAVGSHMSTFGVYTLQAHPGAGQFFANWQGPGLVATSPDVEIYLQPGFLYTATFLPNNIPHSIAFTTPGMEGVVTNGNDFLIAGTISSSATPPVSISCQISSYIQATPPYWLARGPALTTTGTSSWSVHDTAGLTPGTYSVQAIATDAMGRSTIITNTFTVLTGLALTVDGPGTTSYGKVAKGTIAPVGNYLEQGAQYTLIAKPAKGASFVCWSNASGTLLQPEITFNMSQGLALTAVFISNDIPNTLTVTSPKSKAQLTTGDNFQLAGATSSSLNATQILCQIYLNFSAVTPALTATIAGHQWSLATGSNLPPGANYVAQVTAYDAQGRTTVIQQPFGILAKLSLTTASLVPGVNNLGSVTVAPPGNNSYFPAGETTTLTAKPKAGYLFAYWVFNGATNYYNPVGLTMSTNEAAVCYFASNYYQNVSGNYTGIFYTPNQSKIGPYSSGSLQMSLQKSGSATLYITFPNHQFTVTTGSTHTLPYNGQAGAVTADIDGYYLNFGFSIDLTNHTGSMTGYVYNYLTGTLGNLNAYLNDTDIGVGDSVTAGNYVLTIPGQPGGSTNQPEGDGYATYSISSSGVVKVVGSLADGTAISESTSVSSNGIWPLYLPLYKTKNLNGGILIGWQTNYNPSVGAATNAGLVAAWELPQKFSRVYAAGFSVNTNTTLALYQPPVPGSSYNITFAGASLAKPIAHTLTVTSAKIFSPVGTTDTDGQIDNLAITMSSATTGALAGKFTNPANGATLQLHAAFASPSTGGSGYFLDTSGLSGSVTITQAVAPADAP